MATLKRVIECLNDPTMLDDVPVSIGSILNLEVQFNTDIHHGLHLLSTYVSDGILHIDIGE